MENILKYPGYNDPKTAPNKLKISLTSHLFFSVYHAIKGRLEIRATPQNEHIILHFSIPLSYFGNIKKSYMTTKDVEG